MSKIFLPKKVEEELDLAIKRAKTNRKILHASRYLDYALEDFEIQWSEILITEETFTLLTEALTPARAQEFLLRIQKKAIPKSIWKLAIEPYWVEHKLSNRIVTVFEFVRRRET